MLSDNVSGNVNGDLISRKDAKFIIKQIAKQLAKQNGVDDTPYGLKIVYDDIGTIPAVDAVPVVHGRWEHLGGDEWRCSVCDDVIHTEGSWEKPSKKYCSECGAKMDGDERERI